MSDDMTDHIPEQPVAGAGALDASGGAAEADPAVQAAAAPAQAAAAPAQAPAAAATVLAAPATTAKRRWPRWVAAAIVGLLLFGAGVRVGVGLGARFAGRGVRAGFAAASWQRGTRAFDPRYQGVPRFGGRGGV